MEENMSCQLHVVQVSYLVDNSVSTILTLAQVEAFPKALFLRDLSSESFMFLTFS